MIYVHRIILSILFSIVNWQIINALLIKISFWKYFIFEISILIMVRVLIFTYEKLGLGETEDGE